MLKTKEYIVSFLTLDNKVIQINVKAKSTMLAIKRAVNYLVANKRTDAYSRDKTAFHKLSLDIAPYGRPAVYVVPISVLNIGLEGVEQNHE